MSTARYIASQRIINWNRHLTTTRAKAQNVENFKFDDVENDDEEKALREAEIKAKQNKSKLFKQDYNKQNDKKPYAEPVAEHHETLRYRRRSYGKFGADSNVDPSILWPSKVELDAIKEYEAILQPLTFHQLVKKARDKREQAEAELRKEEEEILAKLKTVKKEIAEFHKRVAKKNQKALEVVERKNRLIEEVRSHFGYNIDIRDERFKELFEKKQKEERKQMKAMKQEKMKQKQSTQETEETDETDDSSNKKLEEN
ncbi:hypothetical protein RUM44_012972 [Polyplax serrata]|uniref:Large ribosomal subunit protein mL64 n=1 Tax=Polyplax serrata TaxID=468196 RepID=A0ABR1BCU4_POLSC